MNWKLIVLGGLTFYFATFIVSMVVTGPLIHTGVLDAVYDAHNSFWRPPLTEEPPDMAELLPMWITTGIVTSLIFAALFGWMRPALSGPGWRQGLLFGVLLLLVTGAIYASLHGVFALAPEIWIWWTIDGAILYLIGGAALGFVAGKVAPPT